MKNKRGWIVLLLLVISCGGKGGPVVSRGEMSAPSELTGIWNNPKELLKKGQHYYDNSRYDMALTALERITNGFPKSSQYAQAKALAEEVLNRLGMIQVKVGILLPLTGRYARFGEATLDGVSCAFGLFDPCSGSLSKIQMVVKDTGGSPQMAAHAVQQLVKQDKVVAIVGPLLSAEMNAAAIAAEQLNVPMISLSPTKRGKSQDFVFQHSLLAEKEVRALADKALEEGVRRFIILYPQNRYGESYHTMFQRELASSGRGEVIATMGYAPDLPDFFGVLRQFVQKSSVSRALRNDGNRLGIFIPDSYRQISRLAQALDKLRIEGPRLIGTSRWHHNNLLVNPFRSLEGAIIDTPFNPHRGGSAQKFTRAFQEAHGNEPAWLEAIGYDAARMLIRAVESTGNSYPRDVRNALANMDRFPGVVGTLSWDRDGTSRWPLSFITIRDGEFRNL